MYPVVITVASVIYAIFLHVKYAHLVDKNKGLRKSAEEADAGAKKAVQDVYEKAVEKGWGEMQVVGHNKTRFIWFGRPKFFDSAQGNVLVFKGIRKTLPLNLKMAEGTEEFDTDASEIKQVVLGPTVLENDAAAEPSRKVRIVFKDNSTKALALSGGSISKLIQVAFDSGN